MANTKVDAALDAVRRTVSDEAARLDPAEYREFLDELDAEAEGWRMQTQEMKAEDED